MLSMLPSLPLRSPALNHPAGESQLVEGSILCRALLLLLLLLLRWPVIVRCRPLLAPGLPAVPCADIVFMPGLLAG